jgi:hypothetical protein
VESGELMSKPAQGKGSRDLNQLAASIVGAAPDEDPIRCPRCQSDQITQGERTIGPHPQQGWPGGKLRQVTIPCTCRACGVTFIENRWDGTPYDPDAPE